MPLIVEGPPRAPAVRDQSGRRYSRYFTVEAASHGDAEDLLNVHEGIRYGATYENWRGDTPDPGAVVIAISPEPLTQVPENGSGLFGVTVDYAYVSRNFRPPQTFYTGPKYYVEESLVSVPADVDFDGVPIANTAKEIYDPPPTTTVVQEVLVIEWTKIGPDWLTVRGQLAPYLNKTNSVPYKGAPPECLKCIKMRVDEHAVPYIVFGQSQFKIRAEFQFAPALHIDSGGGRTFDFPGWRIAKRNLGRRIKLASGEYVGIREGMVPGDQTVDRSRPFVTDPVDIDNTGGFIDVRPWYNAFKMLGTINFNDLGV